MQSKEMKGKVRGLEDVWEFPAAKPTPYQESILRARMAEIGVRILRTNMMYEFGERHSSKWRVDQLVHA